MPLSMSADVPLVGMGHMEIGSRNIYHGVLTMIFRGDMGGALHCLPKPLPSLLPS